MTITTPFSFVGPEISTTSGDATATNQATIIAHLTDIKGSGWVASDNLAEIAEDTASVDTKIDTVDAEVGQVKAKTDQLSFTVANQVDANSLSGGGAAASEIADAVLAAGDVDGYTLEETLKICMAALGGKLAGAGTTTITFTAVDDSKSRITATVDGNGNRTAVTLDTTG